MDNATILFLAQCSQVAYKLERKKSFPKLGIKVEKILRDQEGQVRGFLAMRGEEAIVAIKGTASLEDAAADVDLSKVEFNSTFVHAGFKEYHDAVRYDVYQFVKHHRRVLITGHSLGAAVATLLAMTIALDTHTDVSIATFGSPRVGDNTFVELFNFLIPDSTRVVHDFDIITRIPKIGYYHINTELQLDDHGKLMGKLRKAYNFFFADISGEALSDHSAASYVKVVRMYTKQCA